VGNTKIGRTPAAWVDAYKRLLNLTISERDTTGTHTWRLASTPKVSDDGSAATYSLIAPGGGAGPTWDVVAWDKI